MRRPADRTALSKLFFMLLHRLPLATRPSRASASKKRQDSSALPAGAGTPDSAVMLCLLRFVPLLSSLALPPSAFVSNLCLCCLAHILALVSRMRPRACVTLRAGLAPPSSRHEPANDHASIPSGASYKPHTHTTSATSTTALTHPPHSASKPALAAEPLPTHMGCNSSIVSAHTHTHTHTYIHPHTADRAGVGAKGTAAAARPSSHQRSVSSLQHARGGVRGCGSVSTRRQKQPTNET